MDLRDYVRMLRRGWPTVLVVLTVVVCSALLYAVSAPKKFSTSTVIFLDTTSAASTTDLQQGLRYVIDAASSYAAIIDSPAVLAPAANQLHNGTTVAQLAAMVEATSRPQTALIDINVTADTPQDAAVTANAVAESATKVIAGLANGSSARRKVLIEVAVTKRAAEPSDPISPNTSGIILIAVALGLALGLAVTITRQALDSRLHQADDVEKAAPGLLLTTLPKLTRRQRLGIVVRDDPTSLAVESYRALRTYLISIQSTARRSIVVASIKDGREDVQLAVNIAWSLAQAGRRVLLVDLDVRLSPISAVLGLDPGPGLMELLERQGTARQVIRPTSQHGVDAVVAGTTTLNSSDLLSGPAMGSFLRQVEAEYDFVILHAPPLLSYADGAVVSVVAGHVLVTVSAHHTRAADLTATLGLLKNLRLEPMGLVLAGARTVAGDPTGQRLRNRGLAIQRPRAMPRHRVNGELGPVGYRPAPEPGHGAGPNGAGPNGAGPNGATAHAASGPPPAGETRSTGGA